MKTTNKKTLLQTAVKIMNLILITLPLACSWFFYYAERADLLHPIRMGAGLTFLFFVLYYLIGKKTYDAFRISFYRISELCQSQFLSYLIADTCLFILLWFQNGSFPNIFPSLLALAAQAVLSLCWCFLSNKWYCNHFSPGNTVVIHDGSSDFDEKILRYGRETRFRITGKYSIDECLNDLTLLDGVKIVFLDSSHTRRRDDIITYCIEKGITCFVIPMVNDAVMSSAIQAHMMHTPMLKITRFQPRIEYTIVKRLFDIILSGVLIVLFSPVLLVIAILIRKDGGPAFYKQARLTLNGKEFKLIKFRSMIVDAEKGGYTLDMRATEEDPRITRIGRFIRATRLDELPQLFNILAGEMSFIGPRPERVEHYEAYCKDLPDFRLRLQVKAGLTGLAQVYGQYNTPPAEKLTMDLLYISTANIWEDCRLFFATFLILFRKDSTEGFSTTEKS